LGHNGSDRESLTPNGLGLSPRSDNSSENLSGQDFISQVIALLPQKVSLTDAVSALEEAMIRKAMGLGHGVQSRAADLLGLRRNVFKYKWDKYVDLPPTGLAQTLAAVAPEGGDLVSILADFEEELLRKALVEANGAPNRAADLLGLKRNVMPYKLKKYPGLMAFDSD
jgi:DNA-binding protein Fis